jgi:aspartate carbamoyltransferase regulatory subunit
MNLFSAFDKLDKLYESAEKPEETNVEQEVAAADDKIEIEIVDDEEVDDASTEKEPSDVDAQLVLACSKCGGIIVKPEADANVAEDTGIANIDEACQYCENTEGYKVLGIMTPYGAEEAEPEE